MTTTTISVDHHMATTISVSTATRQLPPAPPLNGSPPPLDGPPPPACVDGHNHNHHEPGHHCQHTSMATTTTVLDGWPPPACVNGHHHDYSTDRHHHHSTYCHHQHMSMATAITRWITTTITTTTQWIAATTAIRRIATNMRQQPPPPPAHVKATTTMLSQRQTSIPERQRRRRGDTHGKCHRDATTILFQLPTFFFLSPFLNLFLSLCYLFSKTTCKSTQCPI